jgi:hypothetical protein
MRFFLKFGSLPAPPDCLQHTCGRRTASQPYKTLCFSEKWRLAGLPGPPSSKLGIETSEANTPIKPHVFRKTHQATGHTNSRLQSRGPKTQAWYRLANRSKRQLQRPTTSPTCFKDTRRATTCKASRDQISQRPKCHCMLLRQDIQNLPYHLP